QGEVLEFREKSPGPAPTNRINAGAYVLERSVADLIPAGRAVSFEREVFPQMVGNGLYGWAADGYWIDIGTPERYLEATWDLLAGRVASTLPQRDETGSLLYEPSVTMGAHIGPQSVLGPRGSVDRHAREGSAHDDPRLRTAAVGRGRQPRRVCQLLGQHGGDAALLRAGRRNGRTARRGDDRRPAGAGRARCARRAGHRHPV